MHEDLRDQICNIMHKHRINLSKGLGFPGEPGIYPDSKCVDEFEKLVRDYQIEAIGWAHAHVCSNLDKGVDPRKEIVPLLLERAKKEILR